jgi:hypothetical protein
LPDSKSSVTGDQQVGVGVGETGVGVTLGVSVAVAVLVGLGEAVGVDVLVGIDVAVDVFVGVAVTVDVFVGVAVTVDVGVGVKVEVGTCGVGVFVAVRGGEETIVQMEVLTQTSSKATEKVFPAEFSASWIRPMRAFPKLSGLVRIETG